MWLQAEAGEQNLFWIPLQTEKRKVLDLWLCCSHCSVRRQNLNCCFVVGPLLRSLVSVFTPIYWTTVLQSGAARNGYSFTQGQFRQESQLEFETGEIYPSLNLYSYAQEQQIYLLNLSVFDGFYLLVSIFGARQFVQSLVRQWKHWLNRSFFFFFCWSSGLFCLYVTECFSAKEPADGITSYLCHAQVCTWSNLFLHFSQARSFVWPMLPEVSMLREFCL